MNRKAKTGHNYNLFLFAANDHDCCNAGDRLPGVWFYKGNTAGGGLLGTWNFTLDAGTSYSNDRAWHTLVMDVGAWYTVKITQKVAGTDKVSVSGHNCKWGYNS